MSYKPSTKFEAAASYLSNTKSLPKMDNAVKLELYGLFKYLTVSNAPNTKRPSIFDMTARAKWDAWQSASAAYSGPEAAEQRYLDIAQAYGWSGEVSAVEVAGSSGGSHHSDDSETESAAGRATTSRRGGADGGGGMGASVSFMSQPVTDEDRTLHGFAVSNDSHGLERLLKESPGIDVNQPDEYGYTPLHLAADRGNAEIIKILLAHGSDPGLPDQDGFKAQELAEVSGHTEIVELLSH